MEHPELSSTSVDKPWSASWLTRVLTEWVSGPQMVVKSRVLELGAVKVFVLDEADNMLDSGTMGEQSIQVKK